MTVHLPVERAHQELSFDIYIYTFHPKCHLCPSVSHPSLCTIIVMLGCAAKKRIFHFHYRLIIVVVDYNKAATKVVLYLSFYSSNFKMNSPTYNFTGVIFYWGICTFTQILDLWATT